MKKLNIFFAAAFATALSAAPVMADQVILDDLIVDGSICAGMDCINGESFGFDTLRLKENNLRIRAVDTSSTSSFPSRDWQITFNDSANGGQNKFSIDDIDGGRTPFTIEAGAPSHSLYVDDGGRIGLGTSTPVVQVHTKDGNTPTLRLEQDGSSGFTPQTWDVAGNETNFFIRDATNGSTLPFRIFPGAPSNALNIEASTGHIGLNVTSPAAQLHMINSGSGSDGLPRILFDNGDYSNPNSADGDWYIDVSDNGALRISLDGSGQQELQVDPSGNVEITGNYVAAGNVEITGNFISNGNTLTVPDYVFDDGYPLRNVSELKKFISKEGHLPNVPSATEVAEKGINMNQFQMALLEKIEELTLYTISQEELLTELQARLDILEHKPESSK